MEDELILLESDKQKLDGIVQKMESNNESEENIRWVVEDFKKKYGSPPKGAQETRNTDSKLVSVDGKSSLESQQEGVITLSDSELREPKTLVEKIDAGLIDTSYNPEAVQTYDKYLEAKKVSDTEVDKKFEEQFKPTFLNILKSGLSGGLHTPTFLPTDVLSPQEIKDNLEEKRGTDFLAALPDKKREELQEYQAIKIGRISGDNLNLLSENRLIEEKANQLLLNRAQFESVLKYTKEKGEEFPEPYKEQWLKNENKLQQLAQEYKKNWGIIEKNDSDLGSAQEELDLFKKEYGKWENFSEKLKLTTEELTLDFGDFTAETAKMADKAWGAFGSAGAIQEGSPATQEFFSSKQEIAAGERDIINRKRNLLRPNISVTDIESVPDFFRWTTEQTAQQIPIYTALALGGGYGLAAISAASGGSQIAELKEDVKQGRIQKTDEGIYISGLIDAGAEYLGEYFTLGVMNRGGRVIKSALKGGLKNEAKRGIGGFFYDTMGESSSEGFTQIMQNINDKYITGKEDTKITDGVIDAMASGGLFGGGINTISHAPILVNEVLKPFHNSKVREKLNMVGKNIFNITQELNKDIEPEVRKVLEDNLKSNVKTRGELLEKTVKDVEGKSVEQLKKIEKINDQLKEAGKEYKAIKDSSIPPDLKQQLLDQSSEKIKNLKDKKDNLIAEKEKEVQYQKNIDDAVIIPDSKTEGIVEEIKQEPKQNIKEKSKATADRIRELKFNKTAAEAMSKLQSDPTGIFKGVWDGAVETVATSIEVSGNVAQAIDDGIKYIKETDWYKNLSDKGKRDAESMFKQNFEEEYFTPEDAYKKSKDVTEQARKEVTKIDRGKVTKAQQVYDNIVDETIDRQGSIKRKLRNIGLDKVNDYLVNRAGYSSRANNITNKAYKNTFSNLSNENIKNLEDIIFHLRTISIDKNRKTRGLDPIKRQGGFSANLSEKALEGYKNQLGEKVYNDLIKRANNYFDVYKGLLKDMLDEGIINQGAYDSMAEVDYQPTVFLKFLKDIDENFLVEELEKIENISLSGKQIQSIKEGSEGSQLMDAWYILQKSALSRSAATFSNRLNKTFIQEYTKTKEEVDQLRKKENLTKEEKTKVKNFEIVEDNVRLDKVTGFKENGKPEYARTTENNKGYSPIYYYENGVPKRVWLKDDFYKKFTNTNNNYLSSGVKETIALASGTAFVKTLATGNNPLFFITNTPRDFLFTSTFSKEYGWFVPLNMIKLTKGMIKGVKDVVTNSENYDNYLEHGGGMDFLAIQGKYKAKGITKTIVDNVIEKRWQDKISRNGVKRFLDKFNLASEVGIRMAVFNQSVKNQLKERGVKDISELDKQTQNDVYAHAVRSARELSDFNQGGKSAKALDAAIPYLNAAIQGTRAATNNIVHRPLETMVRLTQSVAMTVGVTVGAAMGAISYFRDDEDPEISGSTNADIYFKTLEGVSEYDLQNYFIIPLGYKDQKGEWRYVRVAKAQTISPILNSAEYYTRKKLAEISGTIYNQDLGETLKNTVENNIIPIKLNPLDAVTAVPMVNAAFAWNGYDAYTGNPLSWDKGKIPEELEGITDKRVEPMFQQIGQTMGVSPIRLQESIESYITTPSTNPYVGIAYSLGNLTLSTQSMDKVMEDLKYDMGKTLSNRFLKSTSEYNKVAKLEQQVSKETLEVYRKHILLEKEVRDKVRDLKLNGGEVSKAAKEIADKHPDMKKDIYSWVKSEYKKEKFSPIVSSLRFEENKEVRALILAKKYGDLFTKKRSSMDDNEKRVYDELNKSKVLDKQTRYFYNKIVSE